MTQVRRSSCVISTLIRRTHRAHLARPGTNLQRRNVCTTPQLDQSTRLRLGIYSKEHRSRRTCAVREFDRRPGRPNSKRSGRGASSCSPFERRRSVPLIRSAHAPLSHPVMSNFSAELRKSISGTTHVPIRDVRNSLPSCFLGHSAHSRASSRRLRCRMHLPRSRSELPRRRSGSRTLRGQHRHLPQLA